MVESELAATSRSSAVRVCVTTKTYGLSSVKRCDERCSSRDAGIGEADGAVRPDGSKVHASSLCYVLRRGILTRNHSTCVYTRNHSHDTCRIRRHTYSRCRRENSKSHTRSAAHTFCGTHALRHTRSAAHTLCGNASGVEAACTHSQAAKSTAAHDRSA